MLTGPAELYSKLSGVCPSPARCGEVSEEQRPHPEGKEEHGEMGSVT